MFLGRFKGREGACAQCWEGTLVGGGEGSKRGQWKREEWGEKGGMTGSEGGNNGEQGGNNGERGGTTGSEGGTTWSEGGTMGRATWWNFHYLIFELAGYSPCTNIRRSSVQTIITCIKPKCVKTQRLLRIDQCLVQFHAVNMIPTFQGPRITKITRVPTFFLSQISLTFPWLFQYFFHLSLTFIKYFYGF